MKSKFSVILSCCYICSDVRSFLEAAVSKMLATFPLADPALQLVPMVDPKRRSEFTTSDVIRLGRMFKLSSQDLGAVENEWLDYLSEDEFLGSITGCWGERSMTLRPALTKLMRAVMSLPHSNASSERTFSMLKKIYTDTRSQLKHSTITSLLTVKLNTYHCCKSTKFSDATLSKIKKSAHAHNMAYTQSASRQTLVVGNDDGDDVVLESGDDEVMEA